MNELNKSILNNAFKKAIQKKEVQIGLWVNAATPLIAEMEATAGYDWMLLDGEHGPNTTKDLLGQLMAIEPYHTHAIVRPVEGTRANIKQVLDLGAQTLLIPMVETAEQAEEVYKSMCYAPKGYRGVGASVARSGRWNRLPDYMNYCEKELCLLVQVESCKGVENLDEILKVEGVDGVFFGPADLSTDMGYLGDASVPEVIETMERSVKKVCAAGKAAGTLAVNPKTAKKFIEWGATFVAIASDTLLFSEALDDRLALFK
jgi:2-dehydro-3-deoxy-L-rhamnonate aldolase